MPTERLAFKPHLRAHVLSGTEVALIGEKERFALHGRAYALLAPLIDGTRSADEIVASAGDSLAPEMAYYALMRMASRGYTTPVSQSGLRAWPAWWLARGDDTGARTKAAVEARVSVELVGLEDAVLETLVERLSPTVHIVDDPEAASLEVCLTDDYLRPELGDRVARALDAGRSLLAVRPAGLLVWLGPFCTPTSPVDWPAFMARLRLNRPADATVLAKCKRFPVIPTTRTAETLEVGLSLAATAIVRCAAGDVPAAVNGAVWTIDTDTLQAQSHALPPGPSTVGDARPDAAAAARPIELANTPKAYTADGGHRICAPEETLSRLEPLVSPISGIIPGIENLSTAAGVYIYGAVQTAPGQRPSPHQNRVLGRPSGAAGKGQTAIQARVSCLAEAVERYSCGLFGDEPRRAARLGDLASAAVHPNDHLLFSERQYNDRDAINQDFGEGFNWIPERFDDTQQIDWTAVWSLTHHRTRWVPSAQCYFGYRTTSAGRAIKFARADSNGCASGNTLEEAILQGLLELIERDACALWWYNRVNRPAIDLASFGQPFFDAMVRHYRTEGRALHVLDLRSDLGIPAAMAVSWREDDGGRIHFGLGCHPEPRLAVSRALTEHNQTASVESAEPADGNDETGPRDTVRTRWLSEATVANQPYVEPLRGELVRARDMKDSATDDIATDITHCVGHLRDLGYETLVLDHTRPDIDFPTARVIVPGLRHFWARLAPGRLYDVPVALGWLDEPRREEDLNPIPFFL